MLTGHAVEMAGIRAVHGSLSGTKPGENQDAALVATLTDGVICAVADGVSSTKQAAMAARTAVAVTLESYVPAASRATARDALRDAISAAHRAVREATSDGAGNGLGATTLVAAAIHERHLCVGNAGDSRAYVLDATGRLEQITADHSWVQERVRAGALDPREAATHPWRSVITRYLGGEEAPEVDVFDRDLRPGDNVLLCSDGLLRALSEAEVAANLRNAVIEDAVEGLLSLAEARGAYDDVTVCVARLGSKTVTA